MVQCLKYHVCIHENRNAYLFKIAYISEKVWKDMNKHSCPRVYIADCDSLFASDLHHFPNAKCNYLCHLQAQYRSYKVDSHVCRARDSYAKFYIAIATHGYTSVIICDTIIYIALLDWKNKMCKRIILGQVR